MHINKQGYLAAAENVLRTDSSTVNSNKDCHKSQPKDSLTSQQNNQQTQLIQPVHSLMIR